MSFASLTERIPARGLVAAGRSKERGMNKTEENYARVLEVRRRSGEIQWWAYEAIKLRLADNTYYTPDFDVMRADGLLEIHEVKGHWEDDARVKIKVAAEQFPFRFLAVQAVPKSKGGGWSVETFE